MNCFPVHYGVDGLLVSLGWTAFLSGTPLIGCFPVCYNNSVGEWLFWVLQRGRIAFLSFVTAWTNYFSVFWYSMDDVGITTWMNWFPLVTSWVLQRGWIDFHWLHLGHSTFLFAKALISGFCATFWMDCFPLCYILDGLLSSLLHFGWIVFLSATFWMDCFPLCYILDGLISSATFWMDCFPLCYSLDGLFSSLLQFWWIVFLSATVWMDYFPLCYILDGLFSSLLHFGWIIFLSATVWMDCFPLCYGLDGLLSVTATASMACFSL